VIYTFYALRTRTKYFRISNPSGADDSREVADEVRGGVRVRGGGIVKCLRPGHNGQNNYLSNGFLPYGVRYYIEYYPTFSYAVCTMCEKRSKPTRVAQKTTRVQIKFAVLFKKGRSNSTNPSPSVKCI